MGAQAASRLQIANDDELVFEFFSEFSRFESFLKKNGFVRGDRYGNAHPDWDKFTEAVSGTLDTATDSTFIAAKAFLLSAPPRKQSFVTPAGMAWSANPRRATETETRYLLRLVQDVRNNLFHGGKYPDGDYVDEQALRDARLLRSCLTVLYECAATSGFRRVR